MKTAIVFPGQGSQKVGMLNAFITQYPEIKQLFEQASDCLAIDLWKIACSEDEAIINSTVNTQPLLLVSSYAVWSIIKPYLPLELIYAGHSLGEYTALLAAGYLSFTDAVKLVRKRAELMQQAAVSGVGTMAAIIGLLEAEVIELCAKCSTHNSIVSAANFNSELQTVVAGHIDAVERLITLATEQGAKRALMLPVTVPSHCELMRPAVNLLSEAIDSITLNNVNAQYIANTTAKLTPFDGIKTALREQLVKPVMWTKTVQTINGMKVTTMVECGPGKVLTNLTKRIMPSLNRYSTESPTAIDQLINYLTSEN